jgi:hypothetical protein
MSENVLSFKGSEGYRNSLISRNLQPYTITGQLSPVSKPINYSVNLSDYSPVDSNNISENLSTESATLTVLNKFTGPEKKIDGGSLITLPSGSLSNTSLEGGDLSLNNAQNEYAPNDTQLDLVNELFIDNNAIVNRFVPDSGYNDLFFVTEKILPKNNGTGEYPKFLIGDYSLYDFGVGNVNTSSDSYLLQISAKFLRQSYIERVDRELAKNTVGRLNLQALTNPFDVALLASGKQPLVYKNYSITVPDGIFDQAKYLAQKISGTLIPTSPIEGEYFQVPENQKLSPKQLLDNAFNNFYKPADPLGNPSKKFLNNTGSGQKSVLFTSLGYNIFKPAYEENKTQIGVVIDQLFNKSNSLTNFYLGDESNEPTTILSPIEYTPKDAYNRQTTPAVFGPDKIGKLYEGTEVDRFKFGLAGESYDTYPNNDGGFIWISEKTKNDAGKKVGAGGETSFGEVNNWRAIQSSYESSESITTTFRKGSILDETQRLVTSAPEKGLNRLIHVGNAINQVSKVFNDGYKEITKGSRVKKYVNKNGIEVGEEYCRVFAKDSPYFSYSNLQQGVADVNDSEINGNIRKSSYSVLDSTYNLNIAPIKGQNSTNVKDGSVKKYMFSIENLAWRNTPEFSNLPDCEKGPNGGRVMWFPPYGLTFSDSSSPKFNSTSFIGRPEPIYTYQNTSRTGSLSWDIIVDHPSVLNIIVDKELESQDNKTVNGVIASFFAGCKKYDLYELAAKYPTVSETDLNSLYQQIIGDPNSPNETKVAAANSLAPSELNQPINTQQFNVDGAGYGFFFDSANKTGDVSSENYLDLLDLYQNDLEDYYNANDQQIEEIDNFFDNVIISNESTLSSTRTQCADILKDSKGKITITLSGPQFFNQNNVALLNAQRLESIKLYFELYQDDNFNMSSEIQKGNLLFKLDSTNPDSVTPIGAQTYNCTGDLSTLEQDYSVTAMACRSLIISNIVVEPTNPEENSNGTVLPPTQNESGLKPNTPPDPTNQVKGISKKILRALLSECNYFDVLKKEDPFIYDSIKQKIKYFNPAFHSMTPEGLNARLVFLNQCTRPGNTIPVKNEKGELVINDAYNTNFGKPPVLILRVGDFYNTKIIPNNLQITYGETLDMNPQGIGLQPMIAKITLSFDIIGGMGLKEPINKIQNALSFNYYANTEMYDERATATEDTTAIDTQLLQDIQSQPKSSDNTQNETKGGNTIGNIVDSQKNNDGSTTGTIEYKTFLSETVAGTKEYFTGTINKIKGIVETYNYGIYNQISITKNFKDGFLNELKLGQTNRLEIFGKPSQWEQKIDNVGSDFKLDVNVGIDPITEGFSNYSIPSVDVTKIKENLIALVDSKTSSGFDGVGTQIQEFANLQVTYYQSLRKMDLISFSGDGKTLDSGDIVVYELTGTTESGSDSLVSFSDDYDVIHNDMKNFYQLLVSNEIIVEPQDSTVFTPFSSDITSDSEIRMYTLFGMDLIDDNKKQAFIDSLVENLTSGSSSDTEDAITEIVDEIAIKFKAEYDSEVALFNDFLTSQNYKQYENYNPTNNGISLVTKERVMNFKTNQTNDTYKTYIQDINSTTNTNNDNQTFNGKVEFNG